jgi:4-oxalocrotonate tautomerase
MEYVAKRRLLRTGDWEREDGCRKTALEVKQTVKKDALRCKIRRELKMPTIIVETDEGRTVEQKRGLVKDITEAVCKNFHVPIQAVTILIHEGKKENRGNAGKLATD